MDDDGQKQRLLDVIGDPHALETFLETLPSSSYSTDGNLLWQGLDSPRFDNVTSSTDSGLVGSPLDNLVFDGQFLGQVRGGSHHLSHSQVPAHVLQQVLPPSAPPPPPPHQAPHPPPPHTQPQQQLQSPHPLPHQHPPSHGHQQQNVAIPSPGAPPPPPPQVVGAPSNSGSGNEGNRGENEHSTLQQLFGSATPFSSQPHSQAQIQSQATQIQQQNAVSSGHTLPPTILTSTASRLSSVQQQSSHIQQQLSVHPPARQVAVRSQVSPVTKNIANSHSASAAPPPPPPQIIPQTATPTATQVIPSSLQFVGGNGQVITSNAQLITSASPLLQGTQLIQGHHGSTPVMNAAGPMLQGQVLPNGSVIQGGQVLHGTHMLPGGQFLQGGQVIQGGQVLQGGQLIQSGSMINNSQLITTTQIGTSSTTGLSTVHTPSYVTPNTLTSVHQQQQPPTPVSIHQTSQSPALAASPFSVPTKSPGTVLPRASPSPSSYHPTTPSPHPSVQSPAPYTNRSPAPSPQTMKSPAPPTPSPAATPTPQAHTNISTISQQQAAGMVPGMVSSIVPPLPLSQVVGTSNMVLPQTSVHQTATGMKQMVPGSQIIQLVSSAQPAVQQRTQLSTPSHKPIQPKQPQLLPKPPQPVNSGQPPPPPAPAKSLIGARTVTPTGQQQPIVIGAPSQPPATVMTNQQGIGGFVINPSALQSGLQQPFLIQQPNGGSMLLVRPSGPTGAPAQAILVPMTAPQPQILSTAGKAGQPQTVVFPSGAQGTPTFVIPQNSSSLGAAGVMGAAQGARGHQPIIRLVAPQSPFLASNGPTLLAIPSNQLNLSNLMAAGGATMRTLAPQVASSPLQLAPSVTQNMHGPVAGTMGHLQMAAAAGAPGQPLQVSMSGTPLQLAASLPSSIPSVITTTKQTVIDECVVPPSLPPPTTVVSSTEAGPHNQTLVDANKNAKKKSKKKKKEKDPKDDKLKSKGGSINLNDILKETGIVGDLMLFDEHELGLSGEGNTEGSHLQVSTSVKPVTSVVTAYSTAATSSATELATTTTTPATNTVGIPDNTNHVVLGNPQPMLVGVSSSVTPGTVVISSSPMGLPTPNNIPSGMCLTLDQNGKVILGADPSKTAITAQSMPTPSAVGGLMIPSSQPQVQMLSNGTMAVVSSSVAGTTNSGNLVSVMSSMPTIMSGNSAPVGTGILPTVCSLPSFTQLLTTPSHVTTNVSVQGPTTMTSRSLPAQVPSSITKITQAIAKNQTGGDISKVAQNTHLLQALQLSSAVEKSVASVSSGPPVITSVLSSGQQPQAVGISSKIEHQQPSTNISTQMPVGDGSMVAVVTMGNAGRSPERGTLTTGTSFSSPLNILVSRHPSTATSQVPPKSAVIVSSSATNSVVSGAIISHKPFVTNSALIPQTTTIPITNTTTSLSYTNSETVPISPVGHSAPQIVSALHQDNVPSHINHSGVHAINKISESSISNNKPPSYQNEYVATIQRSQNMVDIRNKSKSNNKKKKKDKESESLPLTNSSPVIIKQSLHDRLKSGSNPGIGGIFQQGLPSLPNGLNNPNLKNTSLSSAISHPSVMIPGVQSHEKLNHSRESSVPVVCSNISPVSIASTLPTLTTQATAAVQTPPVNTMSSPTLQTTTSTSHTHAGVLIPGGQKQVKAVKHLILSQENQEALKKVHSQIQALQNKKTDQDNACLQQLYQECRKIMATGKHVTVTSPQQMPVQQPPSQPTPVRYSHPVGHKIITLTQFKPPVKNASQEQRHTSDQNKPVGARWKEPTVLTSTTTLTTTTPSVTVSPSPHSTTSPHISPTAQNSLISPGSRPSASPISISSTTNTSNNASMPVITTSTPSPIVPTTSTPVTSASNSSSVTYGSPSKMAPPQCSPVSSTTPSPHLVNSESSPKSTGVLPTPRVVITPQTSPQFTPTTVKQEHSPNQTKPQPPPQPQPQPAANYVTQEQLFEHQLKTDQNGALNPDYRTPFKTKIDACKRLIRYHVYSDKGPTPRDLTEYDNQVELQAESLLKKYNNMMKKYHSLLLKDGMRRHASSETVMLYRLFVQDDKSNIEREKTEVQSGKHLDLPPAPAHWLTNETRPVDPPFPWELEWENQKVYTCYPWEEEEEEEPEKEIEENKENVKIEDQEVNDDTEELLKEKIFENRLKVEEEIEEFDGSQEGDSQLHIIMGDEEDENEQEEHGKLKDEIDQVQDQSFNSSKSDQDEANCLSIIENQVNAKDEGSDVHSSPNTPAQPVDPHNNNEILDTSVNSNVKVDENSCVRDDNCNTKSEFEQEQALVICDNDGNSSEHSSPAKFNTPPSEPLCTPWAACDKINVNRPQESLQSPDCDLSASSDVCKSVHSPSSILSCESYKELHSPSMKGRYGDKYEKDRRKDRIDRDKRKSEKSKDRVRDCEKEDRPPKKLKIKLKHEERAVVPPLRIRTEERGTGLKLTLKKQEGSGAYYRVGEERKREYRVESHDDDYSENMASRHYGRDLDDDDDGDVEGSHELKEVKVVLQDVLKDKKYKLRKHDDERIGKKRRRDRSDDKNDKCERRNRNNYWSNHTKEIYQQTEGEHNSSQQSNYDSRTWNHNSSAEWTRSGGSVDWRRTSSDSGGAWQQQKPFSGEESADNNSRVGPPLEEWPRISSDTSSNVHHSNDGRSLREYSPHLLSYSEHYDMHGFSTRQNHSQAYGHSGSHSRNSHNYH